MAIHDQAILTNGIVLMGRPFHGTIRLQLHYLGLLIDTAVRTRALRALFVLC